MPKLIHFTSNLAAIKGILTHGFAWVPNRRNLVEQLIPGHDYSRREPQQFGMISFTENDPRDSAAHRKVFGDFGIMVSEQWAAKHRAQRVIYVSSDGPLAESLRNIFTIGYEDLSARIKYPDDAAWKMSYENKAMAGAVAGALLWSNLLTLWEYMEPETSAPQREWRIVNDLPNYSIWGSTAEVIAEVSPPENWGKQTRIVPIGRSDVEKFVCPFHKVTEFYEALPPIFTDVEVIEVDDK